MANIDFEYKTINDPVHGSIKVSKTELAVINTPSFQRLRGLKQLGLAEYVFPGATHTRFAHSLGALHIASQMLMAIENNHKKKCRRERLPFSTDDEKQKIRLAALLHDVGHLPLSHAMEQPIQRKLGEEPTSSLKEKTQHTIRQTRVFGDLDSTANAELDKRFSHEKYGMELLVRRRDLKEALGNFNEDNEIGKIFTKAHFDIYKYSQFITGTIDADRIDFFLRDSLFTGVSYGSIDLKYLLDNINYDVETEQFYVDYNGIHTLEHFITARYFLYNIYYHKTIMGFELLAKHAYYHMMNDENIEVISSKEDLQRIIDDTQLFLRFNDDYFWAKMCEWRPRAKTDKAVKEALLFRKPLVELFSERILPSDSKNTDSSGSYNVLDNKLYQRRDFDEILKTFEVDRGNLALLKHKIKFEEIAPLTDHTTQPDPEKEWALCKVFYDGKVRKLIDVKASMMSQLSFYNLHIKRLLYLPLDDLRPDRNKFRSAMLKLAI